MKYIGYICIVASIGLFLYVLYMRSNVSNQTRTFSPYTLLTSSWEDYKRNFIPRDGRVIDKTQNNITTSEGQSYALLRAVWVDDKDTFDSVWKWTKTNLQHTDNALFGWKWGQREDKSYGFLPGGGENAASDADTDIALALIMANKRWSTDEYMPEAKRIIGDIWKYETTTIGTDRYLIAGQWANLPDSVVINPSYFAPYAWRIFSKVDTQHDWNSLIIPAYTLLEQASNDKLDKEKAVGLPPNWVALNKNSRSLSVPSIPNLTTDYSFDAIRVPWRISLDYMWNKEPRAQAYLEKFSYLRNEYKEKKRLASSYRHDGSPLTDYENPSMYATLLGFFMIKDKDLGQQIYQNKILKLYSNTENSFNENIPYYEQNWLWFGAAMYNNFLEKFN